MGGMSRAAAAVAAVAGAMGFFISVRRLFIFESISDTLVRFVQGC